MLRKILYAAATVALLTGGASAQLPMPGISLGPSTRQMTPEEKERQKAIENEYNRAMEKIPNQKKPVDPWGGVRQNPSSTAKSKQGQQ